MKILIQRNNRQKLASKISAASLINHDISDFIYKSHLIG
jgi:hypothetical protein